MSELSVQVKSPRPPCRKLRAFAFDPVLSRRIETSVINEVTLRVPWEREGLNIGPSDSCLEVVDYDPASRAFYPPVDLMDPHLLAQDGLQPAEGNPQFHQQMAYAVARTTVAHFESALGRRILWSPRWTMQNGEYTDEYVDRLRIYPHALREANAYYDPEKKALLFGYFPASSKNSGEVMPGETVFSCISHDIVAHETTHAIIDGLHPRFIEPTNADVAALHEAIADIVALLQHFTYPEVLKHQIARTRGDLEELNLLGELAFQFGQAIGSYGALRSAIGEIDPKTHAWVPHKPDPAKILTATECHDRGAIFVAAIFGAFLAIYKSRIRDLLRIATGGTGVLPAGEIHPDLVTRLADEAAKTAGHMLQMCIRALDYCPCVDPDIGDYLRAMITADRDLVTDDPHSYRLAVIESFRQWGLYPRNVRNLSVESLVWQVPDETEQEKFRALFGGTEGIREMVPEWDTKTDRQEIQKQAKKARALLQKRFMLPESRAAAEAATLVMRDPRPSIYLKNGLPVLEVHSVRPARRIGPDFQTFLELVIEVTQRRRGYLDPAIQAQVDDGKLTPPPAPDFILRGGCTFLVDPGSGDVRYCIYKDIMSENRLKRMRDFIRSSFEGSLYVTYFGNPYMHYYQQRIDMTKAGEPAVKLFALLNRSYRDKEA